MSVAWDEGSKRAVVADSADPRASTVVLDVGHNPPAIKLLFHKVPALWRSGLSWHTRGASSRQTTCVFYHRAAAQELVSQPPTSCSGGRFEG